MCFYFTINKGKTEKLPKIGIAYDRIIKAIPSSQFFNGFKRPITPVISNVNCNDIEFYQWGLIPNSISSITGAKDFFASYNTLNAKLETIGSSKIYRNIVEKQRCLILASGFFEWQHVNSNKIPYYITQSDESLFTFAGIWDKWMDETGKNHFTYTILTTKANELMSTIHNSKKRMPVILTGSKCNEWLWEVKITNQIESWVDALPNQELKAHSIRKFTPATYNDNDFDKLIDYYPYPDLKNQLPGNSNQPTLF